MYGVTWLSELPYVGPDIISACALFALSCASHYWSESLHCEQKSPPSARLFFCIETEEWKGQTDILFFFSFYIVYNKSKCEGEGKGCRLYNE